MDVRSEKVNLTVEWQLECNLAFIFSGRNKKQMGYLNTSQTRMERFERLVRSFSRISVTTTLICTRTDSIPRLLNIGIQ